MNAAARPHPTARNVAFAVVRDVFGPQQRSANESLDHHLRRAELEARERAFATELAYGTIERRRWLDWQLAPYVGARAATLPFAIGEILRLGAYQLRAMRVHDYAAVSESVQLARRFGHRGTAGLVNAVLRRVAGDAERLVDDADFTDPTDALATRASLPTWIVRQWRERFGEAELGAILGGLERPAAAGIVVDVRRTTADAAIARLREAGYAAHVSPFAAAAVVLERSMPASDLRALFGNDAEQQAEAAAFPVDLLDPRPGERVLDACCGRGNKLLQIAAALGADGSLLAIDRDARKVERARERAAAHGWAVDLRCADATTLNEEERQDAVLVDAPCSGIGIVGRQPEARWRKHPEDGARLAGLQRELLTAAARAVRPGGSLVYSVCSTDRRENEEVVEPFLAAHGAFERAPLPARYGPLATPAGDVLVPPAIGGRDGFYIATLRRR